MPNVRLNWTRSLDGLPLFTLREIEAFFKDSGKTAKLNKRTEQLLNDNFHDNISCLNEGNFFYVRAICGASYRKENHKLCFAIKKSSSAVKYAYCTCRAGKGGWCNHVYALMKVIAKFSLEESKCIPELLPCTSNPCGWTVPRKRQQNVSKSSVMDTTVKKTKPESKGVACNLFDARAEHLKELNFNSLSQCQIELAKVNPMIPFVNSIRKEKDILATDYKETKYGRYPSFSPLSQQLPIYGANFQVYCSVDPTIGQGTVTDLIEEYPSFPHEEVPVYYEIGQHQLKDEELLVFDDLDLSAADSWALERDTRDQANSPIWMEQRKNRVTASKFYEVYSWKRGKERHAENFVSGGSNPSSFVQRKLDHGKMYEPVAWRKYLEYFASLGQDVKVLPCGLVLNANNRWLGCSPDAKLLFPNKVGIGESKCPYDQRDSDLMDVAQANKNFYLAAAGNSLHLKQDHPYYFQVQCQLALTRAMFNDFVVYTHKSLFIERFTLNE